MKKIILALFISIIVSNISYADDWFNEDSTETAFTPKAKIVNLYDNLVGVRYSNISGYGLSISRRFANNYEVLLCGLVHYRESIQWEDNSKLLVTKETKDVMMDFGVELKRDFITTSTTCIYGLIGAYYFDDSEKNYDLQFNQEINDETSNKGFSVGVGVGLRVFLDKLFSLNFNFGYKYDQIDKLSNNKPGEDKGTFVGLGVGFDFGF